MIDNDTLSDAEIVRWVRQATTPEELTRVADMVAARLRRLRLERIVKAEPPQPQPQAVPH